MKPAPITDIQKVQEALIKGREAYEALGELYTTPTPVGEVATDLPLTPSPKIEVEPKPPVVQETPEINVDGEETNRKEEIRQKRIANMAKARAARKRAKK
jgi:hypothetical protein